MARGRPRGSKNRPHIDGNAQRPGNEPPNFVVDRDRLRVLVMRIENLEQEKTDLQDDIKEVYAVAKAGGFDTKTIRKLIAERRRDVDIVDAEAHLLDVYRNALGMLADTPLGQAAINRDVARSTPASPHDKSTIADAMAQHLRGAHNDPFADDELPPAA